MSGAGTTGLKGNRPGRSAAFRFACPECLALWQGNGTETFVDAGNRAICPACVRERIVHSQTTTDTALVTRQRAKKV